MNNADDWLKIAEKDLKDAEIAELSLENRLYHCQQAAEKAIKAVLIYNEYKYPYTHDISKLLATLDQNQISFPDFLTETSRLTKYAVETRYPPTGNKSWEEQEYKKATKLAKNTVDWATSIIKN